MIAKMINIPSDFNKSIFWMIIQFLIIIHSYHQDYVDGEDDADRMGHLLKNAIWEKVKKFLKRNIIPTLSALLLHTMGQWEK